MAAHILETQSEQILQKFFILAVDTFDSTAECAAMHSFILCRCTGLLLAFTNGVHPG